jgi:hypothetical protein
MSEMKRPVSAERRRAAIIARAIKGVRGEQWKALPVQDRRDARLAAQRVIRALTRIDSGTEPAADDEDE